MGFIFRKKKVESYHSTRNKKIPMGISLGIWSIRSKFRQKVHTLITNEKFSHTIDVFIVLNCIVLALETSDDAKPENKDSTKNHALMFFDFIFTSIFVIEMILKIIGLGLMRMF